MSDPKASEVTRLLRAVEAGDPRAADELLPLVYDQLRRAARKQMAGERADHTLQATALVHEAYLRLVGTENAHFDNPAHFYVAAAEAMRRVLIEHARAQVQLRYFAGLTVDETARSLEISPRSVKRLWSGARAWLTMQTG